MGPDREQSLRDWLSLRHAPQLGPARTGELLARFGSAAGILEALRGGAAVMPGAARDYLLGGDRHRVEADLRWQEAPGNHIILREDPAYPPLLAETEAPPVLLYVSGDPALLNTPQIAIVGSRNPTPGGLSAARDFARCLSRTGLGVCSGLALGIDAAAHRGALDVDGATVAVMGTGPDRVYPARNHGLAHRIAAEGALVTEFPPGTGAVAGNFPRRNRLIAGLSVGVLVVEAARRSGALITARLAGEQGREVFAIPGSIHNPVARGCHRLIRQGAKLVETAADVLEELGPLLGIALEPGDRERPEAPAPVLEPEPQQVLDAMGFDPVPADLIVHRTGLTASTVSSILVSLELQGIVQALAGGRFVRAVQEKGE